MRGYFVTGTDTGVGKTVASAALAAYYTYRYWKPVQTGMESDTAEVQRLAGCEVLDQGVRLPDPVSPHLAAQRSGMQIHVDELAALAPREGGWIVEGAGGPLVPLNEREVMADLMGKLGLPVVVVARTTLGTINHTLLTLDALRSRGLEVAQVVMCGEPNADNRAAIEWYGKVAVAELAWFDPLTPEAILGWKP